MSISVADEWLKKREEVSEDAKKLEVLLSNSSEEQVQTFQHSLESFWNHLDSIYMPSKAKELHLKSKLSKKASPSTYADVPTDLTVAAISLDPLDELSSEWKYVFEAIDEDQLHHLSFRTKKVRRRTLF